jgi:uncharacterized alkaline shock family protein YloU
MNENNCGSIKISEEVIASIAITAALEIDGTAKVHQKLLTSAKNIVGSIKATQKGVSLVTTDNGLDVTVQISVKNGYKIPDVAVAVQENVKEALMNMTGINVYRVNVIVSNVVEQKVKSE